MSAHPLIRSSAYPLIRLSATKFAIASGVLLTLMSPSFSNPKPAAAKRSVTSLFFPMSRTSLLASLFQQAGYVPDSNLPALTGQASAPVTLTITFSGGTTVDVEPKQATIHTYTITGKDMDTFVAVAGGASMQFADPAMMCTKINEQYPSQNGPVKRGSDPSGLFTWDLVVFGILKPVNTPVKPARTYLNTYSIENDATGAGRDIRLNDVPLTVSQTIIKPAG